MWGIIICQNKGCEPVIIHISKDQQEGSLDSVVNRFRRCYDSTNIFKALDHDEVEIYLQKEEDVKEAFFHKHGFAPKSKTELISIEVNEEKIFLTPYSSYPRLK